MRRPAGTGRTSVGTPASQASPDPARRAAKTPHPWKISEYEFVKGTLIDEATFELAVQIARHSNVTPRDVLISNGWVRPEDYSRARARTSAAEFIGFQRDETSRSASRQPGPRARRASLLRTDAERLLDNAIHGLARRFPGESAGQGLIPAQRYALAVLFAAIGIGAFLAPIATLHVLAAIATLFFGLVVALRLISCINLIVTLPMEWMRRKHPRTADADLPVYTILVPLFRERAVLSQLTQALSRLDYPADKLDIKLIFESVDPDTLAFAATLALPPNFEFIVVPDRQPRTKPKAVNYALHFARGDFVVIYDAEDRPDPGQLRRALHAFASGPPNLACVQARLSVENASENWLTKQFAIEYAALFSGILPTLQRLGLPIPLGGTSNHFRASALKWLGAWDAFNVTEDADLGMRLYRHGYICRMLDCDTREEAPCGFKSWLYQRTRWLKGWMQTYFVHMRAPLKLWRQLGTGRFLGFQVMVGGLIFSALVHPLFYALIILKISTGTPFFDPSGVLGLHVWLLALFNVTIGYLASMALCLITLRRRNVRLALHILFMPAYWLLISLAAYRALFQLIDRPFYWEKTEHGVSRMKP